MGKSGNTGEVPTVGMLWQLKAPTADAIQDALAYAREKYGEPRTAMLNPAVKVDATGLGVNVVPSPVIAQGYVFILGETNHAHNR